MLYFLPRLNTFRWWGMCHITPNSSSPVVLFPVWLIFLCYLPGFYIHFNLGLSSVELLLLNKMADEVLNKDYVNNRPLRCGSSHLIREA